jgi:outer membrane protein assembly factor BamB
MRILLAAALLVTVVVGAALFMVSRVRPNGPGAAGQFYDQSLGPMVFGGEDGVYYIGGSNFLYYYDYKARENVVVCHKPNCTHDEWNDDTPDEQRCDAYLRGMYESAGFVVDGQLYLMGMNPFEHTLTLLRCSPDLSRRQQVAKLPDIDRVTSFWVQDGLLYTTAMAHILEKDENGFDVASGLSETWLYTLDIRTGAVTELTERKRAWNSGLVMVGQAGGGLYFSYGYFAKKFDGTNYAEAGERTEYYVYHLADGRWEQIPTRGDQIFFPFGYAVGDTLVALPYTAESVVSGITFAQCEMLLWQPDTGWRQGAETRVIEESVRFLGSRMFYKVEEESGARYYVYDIETDRVVPLDTRLMTGFYLCREDDDYFFGFKDDPETGIGVPTLIKKADFYAGREVYISLMWRHRDGPF